MRRLTATDALFLYTEDSNPGVHQHTLKVSVMGPAEGGEPYSFEGAKALIASRLHRLPPFRWHIVRVPGDIHHPVAVWDPDFDLDFHMRRPVSVGALSQGIGLNLTAWSYVDEMNVCLLACREAAPDLWSLTDDVRAAFDELLALAPAAAPCANQPAAADRSV